MQIIRRITLNLKLLFIRLLDEVLVTLFLREGNRIFFALEVDMRSLHLVGGGLPAHHGVFPAVALLEDIPVHAPGVGVDPVAGLGGGFGGLVDSGKC